MAESDVSDYIEVKRFKNNKADGTNYVAQSTVAEAKATLVANVGQQGFFRQGPLTLHPDKQLELGVVYSFYYDKTEKQRRDSDSENEGESREATKRRKRVNLGQSITAWLKTIVEELRQKKDTRTVQGCPLAIAPHLQHMYVRSSYGSIIKVMQDAWEGDPSLSFMLGGDSGLGKSLCVIPLLSHIFLKDPEHEVIWQHGPSQTFAQLNLSNDGFTTKNSEILLGMTNFNPKLTVIVDGVRPNHLNARMILVTSPPLSVTKSYLQNMFPRSLYVREWHMDELLAALRAMDKYNVENLERLEKMLLIWGGVPRYCINPCHDITDLRMMRRSLEATTADHLKLLHLHDLPVELSSTVWRTDVAEFHEPLLLRFASPFAEHQIIQQFLADKSLNIGELLATSADGNCIGVAIANTIVEEYCFALICAAPSVSLVSLSAKDKTLNLPAPNLKAPFSSLAEIEWKEGSLFVPESSDFKTIDGFLDSSTMLQVTCASTHGINSDGLVQASRVMNAENPVRLVFVLPVPDATDFKVGPLTQPSTETSAALEAVLKRLELFALYVPVQTISSRLQEPPPQPLQAKVKSNEPRTRLENRALSTREETLKRALDVATGKVPVQLPKAIQSLDQPLGLQLRPARLCTMPGDPTNSASGRLISGFH